MNRVRIPILILIAALSVGLVGCESWTPVVISAPTSTPVVPIVSDEGRVIVEGNIVPRDFTRIYTRAGGEVAEVLVQEGDVVEQNGVLIRFGNPEQLEAALEAARLEELNAQQALDDLNEKAGLASAQSNQQLIAARNALMDAQEALDDLDTDDFQTDLDDAITAVNDAQDDLDDAQETWDKNKDLDENNQRRINAEDDLEEAEQALADAIRERDRLQNSLLMARANVDAAQASLEDAQRQYDARRTGPDPDDVALLQARIETARAQIKAAQAGLDDLSIRAPFSAMVIELDILPGETLLPNQQVALLADLDEWYVETSDLTEMDVVKISEGDEATIIPDALPELELPATVESIDRAAGKKGGDVTYTARLKLDELDPQLRWGMTVEVRFEER